jgi:predicted nuclease of predicted toxin-antitoxin system
VKILFDQGVPAPLRRFLPGHAVITAYEQGWSTLQNGDLIRAAESAGFELFVTTDRNLKYQQNLKDRDMAILVLLTTNWPKIQKSLNPLIVAVAETQKGGYVEVEFDRGSSFLE